MQKYYILFVFRSFCGIWIECDAQMGKSDEDVDSKSDDIKKKRQSRIYYKIRRKKKPTETGRLRDWRFDAQNKSQTLIAQIVKIQ